MKQVKIIGQRTHNDKFIIVSVIDEKDLGGNLPEIFEAKGFIPKPNIYTGMYPTLKLATDSVKDIFEKHKGSGISGIITNTVWEEYQLKDSIQEMFGEL